MGFYREKLKKQTGGCRFCCRCQVPNLNLVHRRMRNSLNSEDFKIMVKSQNAMVEFNRGRFASTWIDNDSTRVSWLWWKQWLKNRLFYRQHESQETVDAGSTHLVDPKPVADLNFSSKEGFRAAAPGSGTRPVPREPIKWNSEEKQTWEEF